MYSAVRHHVFIVHFPSIVTVLKPEERKPLARIVLQAVSLTCTCACTN